MEQLLILGRYTRVLTRNKDAIFGAGSQQHIINNREKWNNLVLAAAQWVTANTREKAFNSVSEDMSREEFDDCFSFLTKNKFLVPAYTSENIFNNRYSRNHLHYQSCGKDPSTIQNVLSEKEVVILGCGGIGNHVSAMLATSGIGKMTLIDDDIIELTNLTRQILFTEDDIGEPKTAVMRRELLRRNSTIKVDEIRLGVRSPDDLKHIPNADLWIVSADEPYQLMQWVNKWCVDHKQPYINSGYVNDIATFGPLYIPGKTGCYACSSSIGNLPEQENEKINAASAEINRNFKVATFPPVNALSSALCVNDVLKFLGGYGSPLSENRRVGIWSSELFIEDRMLTRNPLCRVCGMKL
ncbi:HesA/MoeB/ThiF family protein [Pectobacterium odoriferum]|uniref:Methylcrotonoyl-CoA carboxylase n=1 Tax=Pectobacterium odoriferum TaxID=78398 RepID=A0ABR4VW32_9GAMM|nr:ThiF family adenylyltransferase [Pectobacterium odoriferum]KGA43611.1 methylcrotonoyl-CoA carboxylase [Pectobacterium odoriferum]MCA6962572.1 ThiF family adenylyltransferase [Pectobacterium odoriferum]MCH5010668.1 ThiF family adenylyltransferase [Pectobacterium odoriferum]POD99287.1 methylcrotonoyl-CoA carboxylase [Pectobacterium odoriferum]